MWRNYPVVSKLACKFVYELMPAALASVIGGLLFTHYGLTPAAPPAAAPTVASAEMVQMVRDEHALIVDYLKKDAEAKREAMLAADAEVARDKAQAAEQAAERLALTEKAAALAAHLAAPEARSLSAAVAAIAPNIAPNMATNKAPSLASKKLAAKEPAKAPVKEAIAPPLQLAAMMNVGPVPPLVLPLVKRGNVVIEKARQVVATVERIPGWVREAANWVAELPAQALPKSPERNVLKVSL